MSEYISREEVLEEEATLKGYSSLRFVLVDDIKSIPPADVRENIHGHWKVGFGNTWCSCSECSGNGSTNWSYCPWCGADMREPKGEKGTE